MSKVLVVNPSKAKGKKKPAAREFNFPVIAAAKRKQGRKRNPGPAVSVRGAAPSSIGGQVKNAALGAVGGIGLDMAMGLVAKRAPSNLTAGPARHLLKAAVALGLGVIGTKVFKSGMVGTMVQGGLTITLHDAAKEMLLRNMGMGEYIDGHVTDLGEYIEGAEAIPYQAETMAGDFDMNGAEEDAHLYA